TLGMAVNSTPMPPAGVTYTIDGGFAVLAVHSLTIGSNATATTKLSVTGTRPLIIVAGGTITVNGVLDAGAHGATAGPAGSASSAGSGAGGNSVAASSNNATGASGAGYGANGGNAGGAPNNGNTTQAGPAGGGSYGTTTLATLFGG